MTFLHPEFIYLMLPILLVLFGLLLTQSDAQERIFSAESLKKLRVDTDQLSAKVRNVFFFLMFFFIILALAAPVMEKGNATVKVDDDLFYIALDISDSMLCEDVYPNRLSLGKKKIMELLQRKSGSHVGLIAFDTSSYLVSPPTLDHTILASLLKPINSSSSSAEGTNILKVLKAANSMFAEGAPKRLILVSDGGENRAFSEEIVYVQKEGITLFFLPIGTEDGSTIRHQKGVLEYDGEAVISRVNSAVAKLAVASGGAVLDIHDLSPFVASMQGVSVQERIKPIYVHFFIVPIALAMVMFLIAISSFHRGEKQYLPSISFILLMSVYPPEVKAEIFSYQRLVDAQRAYTQNEYGLSAKAYESYALEHNSVEAAYNAANAYYRLGKYKMAADLYRSIYFSEAGQNHQLYHNLGNALVKIGDDESLRKALQAYERSLRFKEDVASRENLETVKAVRKRREQERERRFSSSLAKNEDSPSIVLSRGVENGYEQEGTAMNQVTVAGTEEENKWFKTIIENSSTRLYKIEVKVSNKSVTDTKPW